MTRARLLIGGLALASVACLAYVLTDQYASGNVYSEYSSLRTDRMGSAAIYEALAKTYPDVTRNELPLATLQAKNSELLVLGFQPNSLSDTNLDIFEALAKNGNRVVLALDGGGWIFRPVETKWRLSIVDKRDQKDMADPDLRVRQELQFKPLTGSGWKTESPTALSRQFGKGEILLLGSSWLFTNESLKEDRDTDGLEWTIGKPAHIVFDETHLGSVEQGTVMGLARRLRLQGVIAVFVVCALLFIWQSSAPFPPERAVVQADTRLAAASAGEALRNLLASHIPASRLMTACVAEWRKDRGRLIAPETLARIDSIAAQHTHPATQWREIRALLDQKSLIRKRRPQ